MGIEQSTESDALTAATAETGQPLEDLTEEQRDEIKTVVREIIQRAHAYSERGRASMPIEVDSALILAGVTAALLYPPGERGAS